MFSDLASVANMGPGVALRKNRRVLPLLARAVAQYFHEPGAVARVPQVELWRGGKRRDVLRQVERLFLCAKFNMIMN